MDGSKCQTTRTGFISDINDVENEIVAITFRKLPEDMGKKKPTDFPKELLFLVPIEEIYPKRLCDVNLEEAQLDGFESVEDFVDGLMQINNVKFREHWSFLIRWDPEKRIFVKPTPTLMNFIENNEETIDLEAE